ncbi:uncharacterized protein LOC141800207 [Halichoeres trimaculatus]|uniref:uncharacterized protein LOC141800207 n=1 Tax=Halichoeres trimaculatus TaxID=147232 RepID=UPI003D9DE92C
MLIVEGQAHQPQGPTEGDKGEVEARLGQRRRQKKTREGWNQSPGPGITHQSYPAPCPACQIPHPPRDPRSGLIQSLSPGTSDASHTRTRAEQRIAVKVSRSLIPSLWGKGGRSILVSAAQHTSLPVTAGQVSAGGEAAAMQRKRVRESKSILRLSRPTCHTGGTSVHSSQTLPMRQLDGERDGVQWRLMWGEENQSLSLTTPTL